MAIYTPRGLKVRIAIPYAFGLMARLYPKVSPFRILKTTEGIASLPGMLAFAGGIIAFINRMPPLQIGLIVGAVRLSGVLINLLGIYIIPGLISLSTLFSYINGWGLLFIVASVVGFIFAGWQGVMAFFIAQVIVMVISLVLDFWQVQRYNKLTGYPFTSSEVNFFNAYRLHASRLGITTDIDLKDEEMSEDYWGPVFEDFASKWPEVVSRFTTS
ncbi:hypothetical protein FJZ33_04305 [Candidatus Poribacteria bacterium]|nr:hypothetical protein [Candidatus Poribacteria bacterium]